MNILSLRSINVRLPVVLLSLAIGLPAALAQRPSAPAENQKTRSEERAVHRERSLRAIASHLGIKPGSVIADIGAGDGPDVWVFAHIVGEDGQVIAEEIDEAKVDSMKQDAEKRSLPQVEVILGKPADPCLPADTVDLAFMHRVYHHVTQPREMLQGTWKALKPGGYLVIIDKRLGTLTDWVPREDRGKKHYWIAETTVVREACEQGFRFVEYAESFWHEKDMFVLVFQRPFNKTTPGQVPDPLSPIPETVVEQLVPGQAYERVAFVALGEGRQLIAPILGAAGCEAVDIVLEEWATQKDERPPLPAGITMPSVLTEKGDPHLGPEPLDAVYFLDSYHRLFHAPVLLARLRERLTPSGRVCILDRQAPHVITHREASHRRMIAAETVKQEMADAGFRLLREELPPTPARFLLVFGKVEPTSQPATESNR